MLLLGVDGVLILSLGDTYALREGERTIVLRRYMGQRKQVTTVYMCEVRQILVGLIREDFLLEESFLAQLECRTELIPNSSPFLVGSSNAFSEKERQTGGDIGFW